MRALMPRTIAQTLDLIQELELRAQIDKKHGSPLDKLSDTRG